MLDKPKILRLDRPRTVHKSFRISEELLAHLDDMAKSRNVTRNNLVSVILYEYVKAHGNSNAKRKKTDERKSSIFG